MYFCTYIQKCLYLQPNKNNTCSHAINCKSSGGNAHLTSPPAEDDSGLERWERYKENQIIRTQVLISSCSNSADSTVLNRSPDLIICRRQATPHTLHIYAHVYLRYSIHVYLIYFIYTQAKRKHDTTPLLK